MKTVEIKRSEALLLGGQVVLWIILSLILKTSMFYGFLGGLITSIVALNRKGFTLHELFQASKRAFVECHVIFIIILLMGAMISVWLASGTIPYIIYLGLGFISGKNVVLMAFIITGLVALTMGTALGAFSTIGIALLAIGKAYGVPVPLMMGAILSGAFISDKMAPVAGLVNLTLNVCEVSYKEYVKKALKTLFPTVVMSAVIFAILGKPYVFTELTPSVLSIQGKLVSTYLLTPVLLLLPLIIMGLALFGITTVRIMSISLFTGSVFSVLIQKISLKELIHIILRGYHPTFDPELAEVLSGGGIIPMIEVIFIILTVLSISYIFEHTGVTGMLTQGLLKNLNSVRTLYLRTGLLSMLMTTVCCDQAMGIIMPAKIFKTHFDRFHKERATLAQIIADTGIIIAPLEFWNVNALIITALTGVHAFQYGPYTVLCYLTPVVWLIGSLLNNEKQMSERHKESATGRG